MADDLDAILAHFGIPDVPPTEELDTIDRLVAEVRRLRAALNNRDAAWEARLQQAYDDGDLNCDPWDIWPQEQGDMHPGDFITAQRAIDAGWTPPPDPHEDIARELYAGMFTSPWNPERSDIACDLLAAVRRIPDHLARDVAEALRGES